MRLERPDMHKAIGMTGFALSTLFLFWIILS
jgi:hypothetical protein